MAKQGKIARMCVWERGMKFKSGKRRGEKTIDVLFENGHYFYCLRSHRATCKTHPFGLRGKHYWRPIQPYLESVQTEALIMTEESTSVTNGEIMNQEYHNPALLLRCKHCGKVYQMTAIAKLDSDEEFLHDFAMSVSEAARNGEQMEVYYGDKNPEWCECNNE
ncbi:MAG: hypothetical protein IJ551_09620 [Prevotella sp.]|nr:hypothetical protein [Prevotella sp.]